MRAVEPGGRTDASARGPVNSMVCVSHVMTWEGCDYDYYNSVLVFVVMGDIVRDPLETHIT